MISPILSFQIPQAQRRQLTTGQQNQILSDIQQHQHRFAVHQNQNQNQNPQFNRNFNGRAPPSFVQQPSISVAFPPQTSTLTNNRFQQQLPSHSPPPTFRPLNNGRQVNNIIQHHTQTNFVPNFLIQQSQTPQQQSLTQNLNQQRQTHFQRSVHNQVGQPGQFNAQPQQTNFNPFQQNAPFTEQFGNFQNRPQAAPLTQQNTQQQFVPLTNNIVRFPNTQQSPIQNNFALPQAQISQVPVAQPVQTIRQNVNNFVPQNVAPIGNFQPNQFVQPTQSLPVQQRQNIFRDTRTDEDREREQRERQKLIEKHEKFVQKQQQKQQLKVQELHNEFIKKQQQIQEQTQKNLGSFVQPQQQHVVNHHRTTTRSRGIAPGEESLFEKSVKQYYEVHPTTTTNPPPVTTYNPSSVIPLKKSNKKTEVKTLNAEDIQLLLQGNRQKLFNQLRLDTDKVPKSTKAKSTKSLGLGREDLLKQLKLVLAEHPQQDLGDKNFTTMDLVLPSGEKVQVIRTSDPELIRNANVDKSQIVEQIIPTSTAAPISILELAKSGLIPDGANFEVLRQSTSGNLKEIEKVSPQKKVTFVYLEEQDDGSYKIQGVKSNKDKEAKTSGDELNNILERINKGEIKLPPPSLRLTQKESNEELVQSPSSISPSPSPSSLPSFSPSFAPNTVEYTETTKNIHSTVNNHKDHHSFVNTRGSTIQPSTSAQTIVSTTQAPRGSKSFFTTVSPRFEDNGRSPYSTLPTFVSGASRSRISPTAQAISSTNYQPSSLKYVSETESQKYVSSTLGAQATTHAPIYDQTAFASTAFTTPSPAVSSTSEPLTSSNAAPELTQILRNAGLFAMSKYLKQSGLDAILNETGPYTLFVPTDKAFKSLLVQLGGPEKAEEKFKNNPRLLSGLLLHHVIPGSFKIEDLQDEMTGVSLAGTQLRVNQYNMQDVEWNDVKVGLKRLFKLF